MLPDAYFAGFFDADGCVGIARKRPRGTHHEAFMLHAQIAQVDLNPLTRFHERFGGSIRGESRRTRSGNPVYMWAVVAREAEEFLLAVAPFLVLKRERAELALEFRGLYRGEWVKPRRWHERRVVAAKCERIQTARGECYERMRVLNMRGRDGKRVRVV